MIAASWDTPKLRTIRWASQADVDRVTDMARNVVLLIVGVGLLLCALLCAYFAAVPHSLMGWLALVGLGVPTWVFLEWLGETVVGLRFFTRFSSGVRILLGVPTALAIMTIAWACVRLVQIAVFAAG